MNALLTFALVPILAMPAMRAESAAPRSDLVLWYDKPAARWEQEALPIGNAYMGAMIFGGVGCEHIQFNEESLWVGDEDDTGAYQAFGDVLVQLGDTSPAKEPEISSPSGHGASGDQGVEASCDDNRATKWCFEHKGVFPIVWQAQVLSEQKEPLTSYTLTSANDVPGRDPKAWRFLGSQDGKKWTLLDDRKDVPIWPARNSPQTFPFTNKTIYAWYRFEFLAVHGVPHFQIAEIALGPIPLAAGARQSATMGTATAYRRELDISRAVHTVTYEDRGLHYRREAFASYPGRAILFRFTADKPGALSGTVSMTDAHKATIHADRDRLVCTGSLAGYQHRRTAKPYAIALNYEAQLALLHDGGEVVSAGDRLIFRNANAVTLILAAGTDFVQDRTRGWKGELPHAAVTARIDAARKHSWDDLLAEHIRDYQSLFNRVVLDLGPGGDTSLPTDVRLANLRKPEAKTDRGLETLLFQFGRYLMISSSRPGSLPANLQGKWNNSNTPPWRCDYHTDINVQMNYWPVDVANLSECFAPYARWVESIRAVRTEATQKAFGKRGWIIRGESGLFGGSTWDWVPGANAWILQNSYDHYRFTGDGEYLRSLAYPAMKEVCQYWIDSLESQPDGTLITPIGLSPEQGPHEKGISFDQQWVWDLFTSTIEASEVLGVDAEFRGQLTSLRAKLLPPKIGRWGQLQEWMVDRDDPKNTHRHISHLVALFPGRQISPVKTPDLAAAARVSLNARGDASTGWSTANKINLWARLHDGDRAYKLISLLLARCIMPNMFDTHPPFQIDGNFGYTAGLCEMLLQSHLDEIALLPALPKAWLAGSVRGLRARGGFFVDVAWQDGAVTSYRITSRTPREVKVRVNGGLKTVMAEPYEQTARRNTAVGTASRSTARSSFSP